jgi:hypothetical protein
VITLREPARRELGTEIPAAARHEQRPPHYSAQPCARHHRTLSRMPS